MTGCIGYDVRVADVLVVVVLTSLAVSLSFDTSAVLVLVRLLALRSGRLVHWHYRPSTCCVRVRGISGFVDGRLTCLLGFLGYDVCGGRARSRMERVR
jgi:hypothetical protein